MLSRIVSRWTQFRNDSIERRDESSLVINEESIGIRTRVGSRLPININFSNSLFPDRGFHTYRTRVPVAIVFARAYTVVPRRPFVSLKFSSLTFSRRVYSLSRASFCLWIVKTRAKRIIRMIRLHTFRWRKFRSNFIVFCFFAVCSLVEKTVRLSRVLCKVVLYWLRKF